MPTNCAALIFHFGWMSFVSADCAARLVTGYCKMDARRVAKLRKQGGHRLKELRETAGLSQRELAKKINVPHYTLISQLENGRGRIPPDQYEAWAHAFNVPVYMFVTEQLKFYDPITYDILFGSSGGSKKQERAA